MDIEHRDTGFSFTVFKEEARIAEVNLAVPGKHNVLNGLAVLAVVDKLGFSVQDAADSLSQFSGTGRRFEKLAEIEGVIVIDDYAHHPTEIKATLSAARDMYPDRQIWAVWQPHTYSRTKLFRDDFASAFDDADHVIVTEIYASRESDDTGFSSQVIAESMSHKDARFISDFPQVLEDLLSNLKSGSVVLVLSAGDATEISALLVERLSMKGVEDA
jgi:UDP-N-acetylmuramate--alanine ligase